RDRSHIYGPCTVPIFLERPRIRSLLLFLPLFPSFYFPPLHSLLNHSHSFIYFSIYSCLPSNKARCLILKSHSKWCHVIHQGQEPRGAVIFLPASVDLRRAPPSSPHLLPRKRQGGRCHTVWPRARSPTASTPSPSAPGRLASPGCRQAERIYLHISTFVPCRRPISARGEAGVLGGARAQAPAAAAAGSRAGSSRGGRAAHCSRSPGLPPRPRPGLKGKDKEAVPEAPPEPRLPAVSATTGSKMVCGGFACSKNCLCALNLLYTLVSLLLIGIAAWGIGFGLISSLRVVGVVIAVGIFLFLIALVGLIGAVKHHQVLLFFYMIILLLVFVVQFSVSCACLALNEEQQGQLLEVGWNNTASARNDIQRNLNCCGFRTYNPNDTCLASCVKSSHPCSLCAPIIGKYAGEVLRFVGGIGLFFSFTEILGVWLTYRYRNQKDPRANPSAFL
uniref:Tetraspanin 13 n=7 Tax=Felidae TaxID=9681 RepID=A0A8C8WQ39_PANLE